MLDNEELNPDKRAKELHNKLKFQYTKRSTTTAVLNTKEGTTLVSSSEKLLRKEVLLELKAHEKEAKGKGHAEEKLIAYSEILQLTPTEIGASRPICIDCEKLITEKQIEIKSDCSGKLSKKRK